MGLGALVVDLGHGYMVKQEMQAAVESGAKSGARALNEGVPSGSRWNWSGAVTAATHAVQKNYADTALLSDFDASNVEKGYWDITWTKATAPAHLNGYMDPGAYTPGPNDVAAVKVSMHKVGGTGLTAEGVPVTGYAAPVKTVFASVLGFQNLGVGVSAVAVSPVPTTILPGDAFPLAIPEWYAKANWAKTTDFKIGSTYQTQDGGQWTSFKTISNNVPDIRKLIDDGNPTSLSMGDQIYIQPGEKNSLYDYASEDIGTKTYLLPIIPDNYSTGNWTAVKGFVPFKITATKNGSDPYIQGHFVPGYIDPKAAGATGPYYGAVLPPKLVSY